MVEVDQYNSYLQITAWGLTPLITSVNMNKLFNISEPRLGFCEGQVESICEKSFNWLNPGHGNEHC